MKSTRGPLALAVFGAGLAVVSGVAAVSASLGAPSRGTGTYGVVAHDGLAPGSVPALVCLLGLVLVGIGAAVHDGRELRRRVSRPARGSTSRGAGSPRPTSTPTPVGAPSAHPLQATRPGQVPRPVHVITTLPPRATPPPPRRPVRQPGARRTSAGTRLELVGAGRRH